MPDLPREARSYIDRATLSVLVRTHQSTGIIPNELGQALAMIAGGVWDRFRYTADRDDFVGDVVTHLLQRPLEKADPALNLFGYFTTCSVRFGQKLRDKEQGDRRRFQTYAAELLEAGYELPPRRERDE